MRLTGFERKILTEKTEKIFGKNAHLILFGSRVNENARGGDIDLLLIPEEIEDKDIFSHKIQFLVEVKNILGDQKIDLIVQRHGDNRGIISTAKKNGIVLC